MGSRAAFLLIAAVLSVAVFLASQALQSGPTGVFSRDAYGAPTDVQNGRRLLSTGDAFRGRKDWVKAKSAYTEALKAFQAGNAQKFIVATNAVISLCDSMPALNLTKMKDGAYQGSETGYVAEITVEVTVKSGKISTMRIVSTRENRALKSLQTVPQQIVSRKTPSVDAFSGATITSYAVMNATANALKQAQPPAKADAKTTADD